MNERHRVCLLRLSLASEHRELKRLSRSKAAFFVFVFRNALSIGATRRSPWNHERERERERDLGDSLRAFKNENTSVRWRPSPRRGGPLQETCESPFAASRIPSRIPSRFR